MLSIMDKYNMEQLFIIHRNLNKLHDRLGRFNYADKNGMKHNSLLKEHRATQEDLKQKKWLTWLPGKRERVEPFLLKLIEGYQALYCQVDRRLRLCQEEGNLLYRMLEEQGRCLRALDYIQEQIEDIKCLFNDYIPYAAYGVSCIYLFIEAHGYKDYLANIIDIVLGSNKYVRQTYRRQHRHLYKFYNLSTHI